MLSSSSSEETSNNSNTTADTTQPSIPSLSSSSSSTSLIKPRPSPRSMEEVWRDINLSSLPETPTHHHHHPIRAHHRPNTSLFQDFLARPFCNEPRMTAVTASSPGSSPPSPTLPASRPITALSLKSGPEFAFNPLSNIYSFTNPFESLPCSSGKKRFPSLEEDSGFSNNGDRRHKRMIKNRESAARSRARKQAYTNELELEVEKLKQENFKLKKQHEELSQAATTQVQKKHSLQRSSTAPF